MRRACCPLLVLAFLLALPALALAQATAATPVSPYEPLRQDSIGTRFVTFPTPLTGGAGTLEVLFTHRFHQAIDEGDEHDLWGLDSGADVGIGLGYGISDHFDVSIYRSSFQENFEIAGKFLILEQAQRVPFTLALRAGADLLERQGVEDPTRPFAQILASIQIRPGVNFVIAPSWVSDTPRLRDAFNVPMGLALSLNPEFMVELEYIPANRDLDASVAAWSVALSKSIGEHTFEVTFGNSRATTVDQYVGGDFAAGFEKGDVRLGFNIVRNFGF